jgi:hypothetical protein
MQSSNDLRAQLAQYDLDKIEYSMADFIQENQFEEPGITITNPNKNNSKTLSILTRKQRRKLNRKR